MKNEWDELNDSQRHSARSMVSKTLQEHKDSRAFTKVTDLMKQWWESGAKDPIRAKNKAELRENITRAIFNAIRADAECCNYAGRF